MRWEGREGSKNVEDRRGKTMKRVGGGIGIGTILLLVFALMSGEDPGRVLGQVFNQAQTQQAPTQGNQPFQPTEQEQILAQQVSVVLKETEDVW